MVLLLDELTALAALDPVLLFSFGGKGNRFGVERLDGRMGFKSHVDFRLFVWFWFGFGFWSR